MRLLVLLMAALPAFIVGIARADDELPKRKPGLWELSWHSDDQQLSKDSPLQPSIARMCIDATTDEKLAAAYDACDPPLYFAFYSLQFTREVVCEFEEADLKITSRAKITFTGDTAYRIDVKSRLAVIGKREVTGGREGKWVGACPADMRPGDLVVGDEPKLNVLEELAKGDH